MYELEEEDIGRTLYFKIVAFYGNQTQELGDVIATSFVVQGEGKRPAPVTYIRVSGNEGIEEYTDPVTINWNLSSKVLDYNLGGFNWDEISEPLWPSAVADLPFNDGILEGAYTAHPDMEEIVVRLEESDGTLIKEVLLAATVQTDTYAYVTDFSSKDPVRVKIIPRTSLRASRENSTLIVKV